MRRKFSGLGMVQNENARVGTHNVIFLLKLAVCQLIFFWQLCNELMNGILVKVMQLKLAPTASRCQPNGDDGRQALMYLALEKY